MTQDTVVEIMIEQLQRQFPKRCTYCGRQFANLKDYLTHTVQLGEPISLDAEELDWVPLQPQGAFALANCACGTTLCLPIKGTNLFSMWSLLLWIKRNSQKRAISVNQLLLELRDHAEKKVLSRKHNIGHFNTNHISLHCNRGL